jgi:hypothetical protein
MNFAELTQVALLGTERQAPPAPKGDGPLEALLSQLDLERRETALLSAAAVCATRERAGTPPARDQGPIPEPCPPEERPRMSERAGSLLLRLIEGDHGVLLPECLELADQAGQIAPPETLPAVLASGAATPELREAILPLIGARGRWLAAQNPAWAWVTGENAAGDEENIWRVGAPAARLTLLRRLRRTNPARARELLLATWKEESPDDRARFVAALSVGLGSSDEEFLDSALDDKRKEVRQAAAVFLGRLPESALARRMTERAKPLLKLTAGESGTPPRLEVTLPAECDKAARRDGAEPGPPAGFGEKAWWLTQFLEATPLGFWTTEWGATPDEILAASLAGEWKKELLEAWSRAAIRQGNAAWADGLFAIAVDTGDFKSLVRLLAPLTPGRREARVTALLGIDDPNVRAHIGPVIAQCRHVWSAEFSRAILAWLRVLASLPLMDWQLRGQFKDFAPLLAPATLHDATLGWPTDSPPWEFWSKGVDEFLAVVQFRADLRAAFAANQ